MKETILIAFSCLFILSCAFSGSMSVFPITTPKLMIIMAPFVFYRKCNLVCIFISLSQTIYSYNLIWAFIAFNVFDHSLLFSFVLTNSYPFTTDFFISSLIIYLSHNRHLLSTLPLPCNISLPSLLIHTFTITCPTPFPSLTIYLSYYFLYFCLLFRY